MGERHGHRLTSELKSAARDALQLGARYAEAGRAWLNQRTTMMNQRPDGPRGHGEDRQEYYGDGYGSPRSRPEDGYGRGRDPGNPRGSPARPVGEHGEYGAAAAERGYPPDPQDRHGAMRGYPDQPHRQPGDDRHDAPRAGMGLPPQMPSFRRDTHGAGDHGEQGYGGGGYSGYAGQSMAEHGTRLEDPSLGIGRYGGGRQMDYGAGIDEDYPRRSAAYGRGYGAGSGYTDNDAHPEQPRQQPAQRSYRGHGPRHYTRSDERILEDICERLTHDDHVDASDVTVRVDSGMVTLSGEVPERWMKHRAEDLADACTGVRQVENRLAVQGRSAGSYAPRGTGTERITGSSPHGETGGGASPGGTQTH